MNARVVSAGSGQNVVVGRGVRNLPADVLDASVNVNEAGPVHEAVDERSVRVLENRLDGAGAGGGWNSNRKRFSPTTILKTSEGLVSRPFLVRWRVPQFDFVAPVRREVLAPVDAYHLHVQLISIHLHDKIVIWCRRILVARFHQVLKRDFE